MSNKAIKLFKDYIVITLAVIIMDLGIYAFKFPNHFSFGGVSGLAVVLNEILGISAAQINLMINLALLVIGFAVLGKSFGLKTAYATVLSSVVLSLMEKMMPISAPLTNQPMLELAYAIALPAVAAAMLFYVDASGGGTDIVAMILKKYTTIDIGTALLISDVAIVALSFIAFDVRTGLFSVCGLLAKSIFVDRTMDQMRLCKYFTIISSDPEPICDFIQNVLNRSTTLYNAEGGYSHENKKVILCALDRRQAVILQRFIRQTDDSAFIMITKSSETFGKGFRLTA
ncbi:YitT family protein [Dorea sp. AM58-8]|uniref:YitT family protein n=1 Tax=Dorea sp. AM58-8 TaxID=2292346 RepID=UPI000E5160D4|nr:YitT family protein [Dorea sp. AM58-8]RGY83267.1 YitT family protein [Dorea sp. AM58-8]